MKILLLLLVVAASLTVYQAATETNSYDFHKVSAIVFVIFVIACFAGIAVGMAMGI